jgi:hypothetical protein
MKKLLKFQNLSVLVKSVGAELKIIDEDVREEL